MGRRYRRACSGRFPAVVLLGPTGSGKTPLGLYLEAHGLWGRRVRHFDFGEHLRRIAAGDCAYELTQQEIAHVAAVVRGGALFEDNDFQLVEYILQRFLDEVHADRLDLILLNGVPRHVG